MEKFSPDFPLLRTQINQLRVRDLSNETNLSTDEVLLRLWNDSIDYVNGPYDQIRKDDLSQARRSVGLPTRREVTSVEFWRDTFRMGTDDFSSLLQQLGFSAVQGRTLPKGAVRKLKAEMRRRQLDSAVLARPMLVEQRRKEVPLLVWHQVGHEASLQMLTYQDIVDIHITLVRDFENDSDPIDPPGVRNENLLQSALTRPHTQIGNDRKYCTVEMAAAALLHSIVMDHPFHNGNKRTGLVAMLVFLDKNGLLLTCDEEELFKLVLRVAQHSIVESHMDCLPDREFIAIANWIHTNCRIIEKGEVPIPFRRLKRILSMFNCQIETMPKSCVKIKRTIDVNAGLFNRPRKLELSTQVAYDGDGREVPKNTLAKIRADLHLDEEHNVDSKAFYQGEVLSADDFISTYRKTLRRLAKL